MDETLKMFPMFKKLSIYQMASRLKLSKNSMLGIKKIEYLVEQIKELSLTDGVHEISKKIGVSTYLVKRLAKKSKIEIKNHNSLKFSNFMKKSLNDTKFINLFKKTYLSIGVDATRIKLKLCFKYVTELVVALHLKKKEDTTWSSHEDRILKNEYCKNRINIESLLNQLPRRSRSSIITRANKLNLSNRNKINISLDELFKNRNVNSYLCGLLVASKDILKSITIKSRYVLFSCNQDAMRLFISTTKYSGSIIKTKHSWSIQIKTHEVIGFCNKFCKDKFDLSYIDDDKIFLCWLIGYLDKSHSISYGALVKKYESFPGVSKYCCSRTNLILRKNAIKTMSPVGLYIPVRGMQILKNEFKRLNITVGEFWRKNGGAKRYG